MSHRHNSHHVPGPALDPLDRSRFPVDEWRLVELVHDKRDLGVTEALFAVANGYLGMRGNPEEGRDSHTHGTYVNGFHETWPIRHAEEAFGLARVGQTIVDVPDPKVLKLYVDDEPLLLDIADLEGYERSIDFREGLLRRHLVWRTSAGKRVRISTTRMTSFASRHLAVLTMDIEMLEGNAAITVSSQILNRQDGQDEYHVRAAAMGEGFDPRKADGFDRRVLEPRASAVKDGRLLLGYRCHDSRMTIAVGVQHLISTDNDTTEELSADIDVAKHVVHVEAKQGTPIRIEKLVAVHTSRGVPVTELSDRCWRTLDRSVTAGVPALHAEHRDALTEFWDCSDVQVSGQPEVQQAVRWNLWQLAQASLRSGSHGIPAKGMTGSGYGGHYFWDTECYVMPFLVYTNPQAARNALRFRHRMLDDARRRSADLAQHGALFPWRTINGEEASAYFAAGTAQYHINADVALALIRYVRATGDRTFLLGDGIDILVETARLWADLGFWRSNGDNAFHIHGVTGPDEYTTVVNDNLFTNVMAQFNLQAAADAVVELQQHDPRDYARAVARLGLRDGEVDRWRTAAQGMFIPFDAELGVHPQDLHFLERQLWDLKHTPNGKKPLLLHYHPLVIYRFQVLKQADVVLAMFLAGDQFSDQDKLANFEYYDPITTGDSTLSAVVQSIVAADVGYAELALRYFYAALFVDLDDQHGNTTDGVHVASAGGVWSALVGGFGGMRDYEDQLTFDPRVPKEWEQISWRLRWHGAQLSVSVSQDELRLQVLSGPAVGVTVRGEPVDVGSEAVSITLRGQGPSREGLLEVPLNLGERRPDGSRITATVPHSWSEHDDDPELQGHDS
ncbi:MAG: glycoside hydrolase family 65 protein [Ornithinimicrobium sp.]|uniref:glycoside hydrolase family 65 protein n=1 Tax=Ornithinimicrobium sp. TaxID=1977084 RepID=UPI003D9AEEFF